MKHKRIILIIIVVIAGICGYVLFLQKAPTQTTLPTILPTVSPTSTVPSETYGLSEYTDQTYGFSFWYPSVLPVTATTTNNNLDFPGGVEVETLQIGSMGGIKIFVVNSPMSNITDEPDNHASPIAQTQYFYDNASEQWMIAFPDHPTKLGALSGTLISTTTANVSQTTISGLVMLPSGRRFDTTIIPLSTTRFLVITDGGGSSFTPQLAETIAQTGATINTSTQATVLEAEATAYGIEAGATVNSPSTTSSIQQLNAPGSVSLRQGGIAEIRNKNFYFTLQSIASSLATIQITPVGCWNSFPSDTPPKMRCMIAVAPIPPQTLSVGQTYSAANYNITLTKISDAVATFSVGMSPVVQ
jgi:hypothetical protein